MFGWQQEQEEDRMATGSESLREFAHNAGMDNPDRCWLLDPRDVWVRNPFYRGTDTTHPEDEPRTEEELRLANAEMNRQQEILREQEIFNFPSEDNDCPF